MSSSVSDRRTRDRMTTHPRHRTRWSRGRAFEGAAAGLVACLLVFHVSVFSWVATHSVQHAHHKPTTHGSLLCTWLCTAGEVSEAVDADLVATAALAGSAEPWAPTDVTVPPGFAPGSRGPPLLSL